MSIWNILCCRGETKQKQQKKPIRKPKVSKYKFQSFKFQNQHQKFQSQQPRKSIETPCFKKKDSLSSEAQKKTQRKNLYEGEQLNGIPHGTGTMLYVNGDYYRGEWVNGLKEGRGLQSYFQIGTKYQGQWKKGQPNGQGKFTQQNGSYFKGCFLNGQKHNQGVYFDNQTKIAYQQFYEEGALKQRNEINRKKQKVQEFPTLVLDKQRFNSRDLEKFQEQNPQILQLDLNFLLKYYSLSKVINLEFIDSPINQWNITQVLDFLEQIQLKDYRKVFYENKIKGKDLVALDEDQLKKDLKMKLGDRKKLMNYIEYLVSLHKQKKTQKKEKKLTKRRGSFSLSQRNRLKNMLSVEQRISQVDNQDEAWKEESQGSTKGKNKLKKINLHKGFDTEDWDQYNSFVQKNTQQYRSQASNENKESQKSNKTVKDSDEQQIQEYFQAPAYGKRKKSQDRHDNMANSLVNINHPAKAQKRQKSKSSSLSNSSFSSLDQEMLKLKKKKTMHNGSQQIRQLYEFLKQNKSLDFIIKKRDIEIIQQIGQGGYGKVYRGKYMGTPVALKDYMKAGRNHKSREDFMKEVYILSDLKHPNIVLYMGMCITVNQYQLVTQFLENGSLFDQIHKKKTKLNCDEIFEIIDDIVKGMVYLHSMKNMIHKDLKSSNVLIDQDWKVKLCDFGLTGHKRKKKKKSQKNRVGTYQWMAPQVIRNEQIDFYSDIYSFGVIIWELLTQRIPYEGLSQVQITGLVGYDDKHMLPPPPDTCDRFTAGLMHKCLQRDPHARPTFIQIQKLLDEERLKRPNMKVDWDNK